MLRQKTCSTKKKKLGYTICVPQPYLIGPRSRWPTDSPGQLYSENKGILEEYTYIVKINPNELKVKSIIIITRMAEDVTTGCHATIGHVEKKSPVKSSTRNYVLLPGRHPEWERRKLRPLSSVPLLSSPMGPSISRPSFSTRLKTLAHPCHPAAYPYKSASVERSGCR